VNWFVTSIYLAEAKDKESPMTAEARRTFGYYPTEAQAMAAVDKNTGNMVECLYNFLVIEGFPYGIHAVSESERWYQWNEAEKKWVPCNKPTMLEGIINWAIG
jgi:hypothetical protein